MAIWVGLAVVGLVALPSNTDPVDLPATLVWQFRLATVAGAATYWSVMGLVFGGLRVRAGRSPDVVVAGADGHDRP